MPQRTIKTALSKRKEIFIFAGVLAPPDDEIKKNKHVITTKDNGNKTLYHSKMDHFSLLA